MGPETPLATGDIDLTAASAPGLPASEVKAGVSQSANQGAVPLLSEFMDNQVRQQPQRQGGQFDMGVGNLGWGVGPNDFFPGGFRPAESRTTQVGKYGGAPIFAPTQSYPTSVIASRLQGVAREQAEVNKAIKDFDPNAGLEDVDAPEYREGFVNAVNRDVKGYVADIVTMHGRKQGYAKLLDKASPERMELTRRVQDWNTTARYLNQATKSADQVIEGMNNRTIEHDPELLKKATEVRRKLGEYQEQQNPKELAKMLPNFVGTIEFYDAVKKAGIPDLFKTATTTQEIERLVRNKQISHPAFVTWLTQSEERTPEALVESLTDAFYPTYQDVLSREEVKKRFEGMTKNVVKEKVEAKSLPGYAEAQAAARKRQEEGITLATNIRNVGGGESLAIIPRKGDLPVAKAVVDDNKGSTQDLYSFALSYDPARNVPILTGRSLTQRERSSVIDILKRNMGEPELDNNGNPKLDPATGQVIMKDPMVSDIDIERYATANNIGSNITIDIAPGQNRSVLMSNFGTPDAYQAFADAFTAQGMQMTPQQAANALRDPQKRGQLLSAFKGTPVGPVANQQQVSDVDAQVIKQAFPGAIQDPQHGWIAKNSRGQWEKIKVD